MAALKEKSKFEAYTSKRSGRDYPGGKVERELEEISETCDDFLTLAAGIKLSAAAEEDGVVGDHADQQYDRTDTEVE